MGQVFSLPFKLVRTTHTYIFGFFHYWCGPGRHRPFSPTSSTFAPLAPRPSSTDDNKEQELRKQHARIHLYTLTANLYLYSKPHYRKGSYATDLVDNLRNVAIPGTGLPLSWIAQGRILAIPFLLVGYPTVALVASLSYWWRTGGSLSAEYEKRLLAPDDWFSYWRLNCVVTGLHALLYDRPGDYDMENKWTFLQQGTAVGVPVSPFLSTPSAIVVKHRNEEGGLGIHFYRNAVDGGDWIIQERLGNSDWVSSLLPPNAPLSTFRVITCSRAAIAMTTPMESLVAKSAGADGGGGGDDADFVTALSCVFRAGREGAATDHDSILFDVSVETGEILGGTTNKHWYQLGLFRALFGRTPWRSEHSLTHHPDGHIPVTGHVVPDIDSLLQVARSAHAKLCPRVLLCGWDVVLSNHPTVPMCLLEVNLSCNFFRGSFDKKVRLFCERKILVGPSFSTLMVYFFHRCIWIS
jgi:hypothetical protein